MSGIVVRTWDPMTGAILRFGRRTPLTGNVAVDQSDFYSTRVVLERDGDYVVDTLNGVRYEYRDGRVTEDKIPD